MHNCLINRFLRELKLRPVGVEALINYRSKTLDSKGFHRKKTIFLLFHIGLFFVNDEEQIIMAM